MNFDHQRYSFALLSLAVVLCWGSSASAQNGDTSGSGTVGVGDATTISLGPVEADRSAFTLERGDTVGAATETGFGIGAESGGGGGAGGGAGFGGGGGGLGGLFGGLFGGLNQGASTSKPAVRVRLRSAVDVEPLPPAEVQATVSTRLSTVTKAPALRNVNVSMNGRTAVLTGAVRTEKDRRMSELLMRLEPGVSSVENRVSVLP
ncbi:BON domain-containing protein [Stieleria varia]|nr:BON domain-containing protein [Stieleria varia]